MVSEALVTPGKQLRIGFHLNLNYCNRRDVGDVCDHNSYSASQGSSAILMAQCELLAINGSDFYANSVA